MPKVSEQYLAEKQQHILNAAMRSFASGSFHTTGMAEIIKESGLSSGTVYRYYRSKDDLIAAINDHLLAELSGRLSHATEGAANLAEVMERVLTALGSANHDPLLARILPQLWSEAMREPAIAARLEQGYDQMTNHFAAFVTGLQARGQFRTDVPARSVAQVMLSVMQGYQLQTLLLGPKVDVPAYLQVVGAIFTEN